MLKILLCGALGRMGAAVTEAAAASGSAEIVAGIDAFADGAATRPYPVFPSAEEYILAGREADVIVDFSHHTALPALLDLAIARRMAAVICTTGHDENELAAMKKAAEQIPIFYSRNMSLGVNLLIELSKKAAAMLGTDFDIEIIEKHHNQKLDAPSGTALMIAEEMAEVLPYDPAYTYDRQSVRKKRDKNEIGIHSVRGGNIVGEHDVIFAGQNEVITLSHSAASRGVFASGALRAALYTVGKPAGLYNMKDVVNEIEL